MAVENRGTYIYAKFTGPLERGEIGKAADEARLILDKHPGMNLLIDDSELRYKDLTANNKMESLEALRLVNSCEKVAAVIAKEDEKLLYYAKFALNYGKFKKVKLSHDLDEAIAWVSSNTES